MTIYEKNGTKVYIAKIQDNMFQVSTKDGIIAWLSNIGHAEYNKMLEENNYTRTEKQYVRL